MLKLGVTLTRVIPALIFYTLSSAAFAEVTVFACAFTDFGEDTYITIQGDGSARIGREQGIGDQAQAYFDKLTGAWVVVEFIDNGRLPSTLTTILKDGVTWHSRHTIWGTGEFQPSQVSGTCRKRVIR